METVKTRILKTLLKDLAIKPTITLLSGELGISRVGLWKVLKKLEVEKLITLSQVGTGKTSTYTVNLNWENPILEKILSLSLTENAMKNQRWISNFAELEDHVDFLIIYGSILHSPREANDLDIMAVVDKQSFKQVNEIINKIQKTQEKKIHLIDLTEMELKKELINKNKAYIDAIKKGVILFGQDNLIKFIENLKK